MVGTYNNYRLSIYNNLCNLPDINNILYFKIKVASFF